MNLKPRTEPGAVPVPKAGRGSWERMECECKLAGFLQQERTGLSLYQHNRQPRKCYNCLDTLWHYWVKEDLAPVPEDQFL